MNKLLVICGPTATGKTKLAIKLAKKFSSKGRPRPEADRPLVEASGWNGEIVSADSRQVYKGMDIGTGKEISNIKYQISKIQIKNQKFFVYKIHEVPVWGWDLVKPNERFSVAEYYRFICSVIKNIWKRGKLPILVGGTGFYIKGVVDGIDTVGIPPDWELRKRLDSWSTGQLSDYLKSLDFNRWKRMNRSDRNNPRRLIRAIEIARYTSTTEVSSPTSVGVLSISEVKLEEILFIGLTAPYKVLYPRIDRRVEERVKQGIVEEIKGLLAGGYDWDNSAIGTTMGYKEWREYFEREKTLDEVIQRWQYDEHQYARRQMTWFKKDKRINWFKITEKDFEKNLLKLVKAWYSK